MAVEIPVSGGRIALVDEADAALVAGKTWTGTRKTGPAYADHHWFEDGVRRRISMHRLIMGLATGDPRVVDHRDGNRLNNTRANLRVCTAAENALNRTPYRRTSGMPTGVHAANGGYTAVLCCRGRRHYLGFHRTVEAAKAAYDKAAAEIVGEFHRSASAVEATTQ